LEAVLREVDELRGENARLRMDATRPASLQDARTRLAEIAGRYKTMEVSTIHGTQPDRMDEAWHLMAEAQQVRSSLMSVLSDLALACGHLSRQMALDGGPMEIDRRLGSRRAEPIDSVHGNGARARMEDAVGPSLEIVGPDSHLPMGLLPPSAEFRDGSQNQSRRRSSGRRAEDRRARANGHGREIENHNGHGSREEDQEVVAEAGNQL
jgi:hypothetical protein